MTRKPLSALLAVLASLSALTAALIFASSPVSAHAPIEWSDPKSDAVVPVLPETVKVRFAEEPVKVRMRSVEPAPRKGQSLTVRRIAERTYEVDLPDTLITEDDNTVVIYMEADSKDGHTAGGIYLLHVQDPSVTTTTRPPVATTRPGPLPTSPPAVFSPPPAPASKFPLLPLLAGVATGMGLATVWRRKRR